MESPISSSYTKKTLKLAYSLCSKWPPFAQTRVVEHAAVELLGQWCSGRSNATPRWDAVSSGRCRECCYGRCVAGTRPTPHVHGLGQGFWAVTATMRWNLVYCETKIPRCHQLDELEHCKWRSLLLRNESPAEDADQARRHGNKRH